MSDYDAGLLNDFGGGNVEWWHDYIRAEIGRCNDFHQAERAELDEMRASRDAWAEMWRVADADREALTRENADLKGRVKELTESEAIAHDLCQHAQEKAQEFQGKVFTLTRENAVLKGRVERVTKTVNDPMVCEYQQMKNRIIEDLKGETPNTTVFENCTFGDGKAKVTP